jgi:hypothetical protein
MDTVPFQQRAILALKRQLSVFASRLRRLVGSLLQLVVRDQLSDISERTQRLGSASVESVTYLGGELRALDDRLSRIEAELAALRELINQSGGEEGESLVGAREESGPDPQQG